MPAPPSYYDITAVPFSHTFTQADFNGGTYGGSANTLWLRRITTAQVALGIFTDKGGTFKADTTIYQSDGSTVVKAATSSLNLSMYAIVVAGTYYIKILRHGGGSSDFDFTTQVDELPTDGDVFPLTDGQLIVNDDSNGFPATVIDPDGTIVGFLTTIPAGETGAFLPSGESIWHDRFGMVGTANRMAVFDADLVYVASANVGLSSPLPAVSHSDDDFYVVDRNGGEIWKVNTAGTPTDLGVFLSTNPSAIAVDSDGAILYWTQATGSAAIHRYDLVGLAPLSDLTTISGFDTGADTMAMTPNSHPGDIVIQSNGTFVLWYYDNSASRYILLHLATDGSVLHTHTMAADVGIDHLFPAGAGANEIGIWLFTTLALDEGRIGILNLTSGAISDDFTTTLFNSGKNLQTDEDTLFAPSASCTIFAIGALGAGGGGGGGGGGGAPGTIGPLAWVHWPRRVPD